MCEWSLVAEGDAVSEISCVNGVMRKERIIIIIIIIIIIRIVPKFEKTIKDSDKIGIF